MYLWWSLHLYLVFTRVPSESYRRRRRPLLLDLCDIFWALINSLVCWFSKCLHFIFHAWVSATRFHYHSWQAICWVPWPVQMFCAEVRPGRRATLCCSSHWSWDAAAAHAGGAGSRAPPVCSPLKHKQSQWNTNAARESLKHKHSQWINETQTQPVNQWNTNTTTEKTNTATESLKHKYSHWITETQTQPVNHWNTNTASESIKHKYNQWNKHSHWITETQTQPVNHRNSSTASESLNSNTSTESLKHKHSHWITETQLSSPWSPSGTSKWAASHLMHQCQWMK